MSSPNAVRSDSTSAPVSNWPWRRMASNWRCCCSLISTGCRGGSLVTPGRMPGNGTLHVPGTPLLPAPATNDRGGDVERDALAGVERLAKLLGKLGDIDQEHLVVLLDDHRAVARHECTRSDRDGPRYAELLHERCEVIVGVGLVCQLLHRQHHDLRAVYVRARIHVVFPRGHDGPRGPNTGRIREDLLLSVGAANHLRRFRRRGAHRTRNV